MRTTRASGNATALFGLTSVPATLSPLSSRVSRSSGTARPSIRTSLSWVRVALLSRFLRLNRTPSSTFSRLPCVYICLRMRDGIFMSRTSPSRKVGTGRAYRGGARGETPWYPCRASPKQQLLEWRGDPVPVFPGLFCVYWLSVLLWWRMAERLCAGLSGRHPLLWAALGRTAVRELAILGFLLRRRD